MMQVESDTLKQYHGEPWRLNFDVLLLIAEYAHPRDLLNFAYTCKRFRELLMGNSSVPIWKTARSKIQGMPDCPPDLTEREYADLAFCARCYGCGKYASPVFWEMRRRYCPDCKNERLCHLPSCPEIIQRKYVLGMENLANGEDTPFWVDKEQMESFMNEYERSSDKKQMLSDKQERLVAIRNHARRCEVWQRGIEYPLRQKRERSIFERLEQLGYEPEVSFAGRYAIRESKKPIFNTSRPLTDKEWDHIWPEWFEIMNGFRLKRLETTVFQSRRRLLVGKYDKYVMGLSPRNTPAFDLLPHVADVARFPSLRDIIRAPEEDSMDDNTLESAFAQLPELVEQWKNKLEPELAELVEIPSSLSINNADDKAVQSSGSKPSHVPTDKLRLACALFRSGSEGLFAYPDVFSASMRTHKYPGQDENDSERAGSILERFGIRYVKDAPYIVYACGLDPNVATAEDMDRRDARLQCLSCSIPRIYNWREATWHACTCRDHDQARWQLISDDSELAQIRAAERDTGRNREGWPYTSRCLLCPLRVGDAKSHDQIESHLTHQHRKQAWYLKQGVDYMPVGKVEHIWVGKEKKPNAAGFNFELRRNLLQVVPSRYLRW